MTSISIQYKELLSVAIEQPFYTNRQSRKGDVAPTPEIGVVPDPATLELFKRMGLLLRAVPGGVLIMAQVHGQTGGGADILRFPARKGDKITLLLQLSNRDVVDVNNVPAIIDTGRLLYLTNTIATGSNDRNDLYLSKAAGISGGSDWLAYAKGSYRFHHTSMVDATTAKVKHPRSGSESPPVSCINTNAEADLLFDLSALPAGMCELWIGNVIEDSFYHLVATGIQPIFGVIELSLDAGLDTDYRIIEADRSLTEQRPRYVARFVSRKTIWRYTFQVVPGSPLFLEMSSWTPAEKAALNIVTNDPAVKFAAAPSAVDNQLVFVSTGSHALREAYYAVPSGVALTLALTKYIGDPKNEAFVKRGLPYPSSGMINATASPTIYSDIFITI